MIEELQRLFAHEYRERVYRVTFADGERYVLTAIGCFGDDDDEQGAGKVVQPVVRRAEAEGGDVRLRGGACLGARLRRIRWRRLIRHGWGGGAIGIADS